MPTVKNNLMIDVEDRLVQSLSDTSPGRVHDQRMCDAEGSTFPPCGLLQDTGFQGYKPDHVDTYQPKKKPQGKERTAEDPAENTMRASIRLLVEHVISGVKRCRMVKDVFRNTTAKFSDQVMEIACGLHNLRATLRYVSLE
jgi:hypothetical protein